MNILIINPKKAQARKLQELLFLYDKNINNSITTNTIEEALNYLSSTENKPDLVFIETRNEDGTPVDFLSIQTFNFPVVYTSSTPDDAYKVIKANAIDYLLEPYVYGDLVTAVNKAKNPPSSIFKDQKSEKGKVFKKRFMVKYGDKIQSKPIENVSYIYAEGKIAYIVTRLANRKYVIEHTLDELEKTYLNPDFFFRINRKFIVHIKSIEEVRSYVNSRLKLNLNPASEYDMIVSREKVSAFKSWLNL